MLNPPWSTNKTDDWKEPVDRGVVAERAMAHADWLCGKMTDEQRAAYSDGQFIDLKWAIAQAWRSAYERAVEDITGVHRPSIDAMKTGQEPPVEAIEVRSPATARAYTADTLYRAVGRKSEALADLTDRYPVIASMMRDLATGVLEVCKRRGYNPENARTEAVITPEDKIVIAVRG